MLMELTLNQPVYRFVRNVKESVPISPARRKWIAEGLSSYSAEIVTAEALFSQGLPNKAYECLAYYIAVCIDLPDEYDYLRSVVLNKIARKGHQLGYEGKWNIIKKIKDLDEDMSFSLVDIFEDVLLQEMSLDDLFGNLMRLVKKYYYKFNSRSYTTRLYYCMILRPKKPTKRLNFREYKDKGSTSIIGDRRKDKEHLISGPIGYNEEREEFIEKFPSTEPTSYTWIKGAD